MVLSVFRKTQRNRRLSPDDDSDVVDNPLFFIPNGHLLGYK